jgi:chemotaxis protein methyltransferase CheR
VQADVRTSTRWHRVSEVIADQTGLHFPPERRVDLVRALGDAASEFGFDGADGCAEWLLSTALSGEEMRTLARHLTIGETYFFRERPSFQALAEHVLPALIRQHRDGDRRLRLWSAACSTGEEAYSLAILVRQVLPDWRDWNIGILATDINTQSLRRAEAGVYGEWSFRECPADFREIYFTPAGKRRHRVHDDLRSMITFAELNLAQDSFPPHTHGMDLILCRNLLIYFTPAHAARLVARFRGVLRDEGWLVVSPSECSQALFSGFAPVNFPGSVLYRKGEPIPPAPPLTASQTVTVLESPPTVAIPQAVPVSAEPPPSAAALESRARTLADQGALPEALQAIDDWISVDKLDAAAHYLRAMVLLELGERESSRAALQRAVFLAPDLSLAHFALGNHARAEARHVEAQRHFANAARQLRGRPADEPVPESGGMSTRRLLEIISGLATDT